MTLGWIVCGRVGAIIGGTSIHHELQYVTIMAACGRLSGYVSEMASTLSRVLGN